MVLRKASLTAFSAALLVSAAALSVNVHHAAAKVGVAAAVNQDANGTAPGRGTKIISIGNEVVFNHRISTSGAGLVQVLLLDGSTFTIGPNTTLTIDKFVYDPNKNSAEVVASVAKGAFRFIGGQASRKKGGVTIKTPTATMGIRGAMVEGAVADGSGKSVVSLIFGDEVVVTGNAGGTSRLYEPGFTMEITGGGGEKKQIRRRTEADALTFQSTLAGRPSTNGGASRQPDNQQVEQSDVTPVLSGAPTHVSTPTFRPDPVQSSTIEAADEEITDIEVVTQQEVQEEIDQEPQTEEPPVLVLPTCRSRVLLAGSAYAPVDDSQTYPVPGSRGLVGGSADTDLSVTVTRNNGRLLINSSASAASNFSTTASGVASGYVIDLPDYTTVAGSAALPMFKVTDGTINGQPLTGRAYRGVGDFTFYALKRNNNPQDPFYMLSGTSTDVPTLLNINANSGPNIRSYSLTQDLVRPSAAPFMALDLYGPLGNFNGTNLLVAENDFDDDYPVFFLTSVDITGSGSSQRSFTQVLASNLYEHDPGIPSLWASRRGSMRNSADAPNINLRGGLGTTAGPDGGHFFGPNAQHFVIGTRTNPADGFYDIPINGLNSGFSGNGLDGYAGDGVFGTQHVASLQSEVAAATFSRTDRQHRGFMVGVVEPRTEGYYNPYPVMAGDPGGGSIQSVQPNMFIGFNSQYNNMGAGAVVNDVFDFSPYVSGHQITFGSVTQNETFHHGQSAFIDDNRFGALQNSNDDLTRTRSDQNTHVPHVSSTNPGSYLVSGRAAPVTGYQHCTTCNYVDWGWWGTRIRVDNDGTLTQDGTSQRTDQVHMGTWVAGDITRNVDLPTSGTATFARTALGTVGTSAGSETSAVSGQYIASGQVNMDFNFGSRSGNFAISNFDGMNASGTVTAPTGTTDALFGGQIEGFTSLPGSSNVALPEPDVSGVVNGAFVNGNGTIAQGVIGQFGIGTQGRFGFGTFVAER